MKGAEILRQLQIIKDRIEQNHTYSQVLKEVIQRQSEQIKELHDRLMARTYPELKEYETLPEEVAVTETYQAEFDENLSGEVFEGPEKAG